MALNWLWKDKCGEVVRRETFGDETHDFTISLYEGNAFMIFVHEYQDKMTGANMYELNGFWSDETHMKRMLGLDKKWPESYGRNGESDIIKFTFYKDKCRHLKKIVSAITEAFDNIEIEILATAPTKEEN